MGTKRQDLLAICLAALVAVLFAARLSSRVLSAWTGPGRADGLFSKLLVHSTQRDLGTVRQGQVLEPAFRVTNTGGRRLVLQEEGRPCCGRPAESRRIIIPPGRSTSLRLKIDTAPWTGRMEHIARYTTNDPEYPELVLIVTAVVESMSEG